MYKRSISLLLLLPVLLVLFGCAPKAAQEESTGEPTTEAPAVTQETAVEATEAAEHVHGEERDDSVRTEPATEPEPEATAAVTIPENTEPADAETTESTETQPPETEAEIPDQEPPRDENETERDNS